MRSRRDILFAAVGAVVAGPARSATLIDKSVVTDHPLFAHGWIAGAQWTTFDLSAIMNTENQATFDIADDVEQAVWRENIHDAENFYLKKLLAARPPSETLFSDDFQAAVRLIEQWLPADGNAVIVSPLGLTMLESIPLKFTRNAKIGVGALTRLSSTSVPVVGWLNNRATVFCHVDADDEQPTILGRIPDDPHQRRAALLCSGNGVEIGIRPDFATDFLTVSIRSQQP